ncbi:MAG TPA: 16S rRNA (guanine(966)-N(2))-methyltransferase RsmD [Firmicutes bacterium]|nr:16S rRNA (guanine(966)-N(2))-methyltransferase RsmD [Bacillota bacterium]
MRVIAGKAKGVRLAGVPGMFTRPTADRVKEALFSILGPAVAGSRFLDLYAGSGAVGLEALSRGADYVVWVEANRSSVRTLRANIAKTGLAGGKVYPADVLRVLPRLEREGPAFDYIFLDPPYGSGLIQKTLAGLDLSSLLANGGQIIAEGRKKEDAPPSMSKFKLWREQRYGDTALYFYGHKEELR